MTKPTWYRALSLAGLAGVCCFSCAEHPVTPLSEAFDRWHVEESLPLGTNRVDVLWVVDNSSSMLDEQAQLGREFASFVDFVVAMNLVRRRDASAAWFELVNELGAA